MTARTCLVVGGRGFVGGAMAARARALGMQVTAVGRHDYASVMGGAFDVVVHAAGNARRYLADRDPATDLDANIGAIHRVLSDVRAGRFVLVSSVDVYAEPSELDATREDRAIDPLALSTYGFHKRMGELVAMRRAPGFLILRLGQMVGPGLRKGPIFDALRGDPLRVALASRYPFVRTESVAAIAFALLEGGARDAIFNVCGRGSVALEDVLPSGAHVLPDAPVERYAIDVSAASSRVEVPDSARELRAFLEARCA